MKIEPMNNISAERAHDMIVSNIHINDSYIQGKLSIENENFDHEIYIENSILENFSGSMTRFKQRVTFSNCKFLNCEFVSSYFFGGLKIENCVFKNYLDFQTGGHNQNGNKVDITNNTFEGFVNFFDCIFEDQVTIIKNYFLKGTNLLGKPHNVSVSFEKGKKIIENTGTINLNDEGLD